MIKLFEPSDLLDFEIEDIFGNQGFLCKNLSLEARKEQFIMAQDVFEAFKSEKILLFEAGTGVGKSLAYLIPGIIHSIHNNRPLVVSTHTIALQEQILNKDLPLCRLLFEKTPELALYQSFKAALLLGRRNYLCPNRLKQAVTHQAELFHNEELDALIKIHAWAQNTQTGLLEELNPAPPSEVWDMVSADSSACNSKNCNPSTCFYRQARAQIKEANVLILNHSLLFTLLNKDYSSKEKTQGVLYPNDFLVLDEAHTIPDIATEHFGLHISSYALHLCLKTLFNPKKNKGLLLKYGNAQDHNLVLQASEACSHFFQSISENYFEKFNICRLHSPQWIEPLYEGPIRLLIDRLAEIREDVDSDTIKDELKDQRSKLLYYYTGLNEALDLEKKGYVYWIEKTGRKYPLIHIRSAPIDCSKELCKYLLNQNTSVVFTSATLSDGSDMSNFQKQIGASDAQSTIVKSPFNYEQQMKIFVATDCPPPTRDKAQQDLDYLTEMIAFCTQASSGGTLVLFTNYSDMLKIADRLEATFTHCSSSKKLLCQGREFSRSELLKIFKAEGNAILLGTDSFWTGVDVQGSSLSQVIITRLPFENPIHPIRAAKCEWLESQGLHPFVHLTLSDALIQFRQGIGRLIRSKSDQGILTILDSRILQKTYGNQFLATLPTSRYIRFNKANKDVMFA